MRRRLRIGIMVVILVIVFAAGLVGGAVWGIQRVSKFDSGHLVSMLWLDQIANMTRNLNGQLLYAKNVPIAVGSALDTESLLLSYVYDDLPPHRGDKTTSGFPVSATSSGAGHRSQVPAGSGN